MMLARVDYEVDSLWAIDDSPSDWDAQPRDRPYAWVGLLLMALSTVISIRLLWWAGGALVRQLGA